MSSKAMGITLAERAAQLSPSPTLALDAKTKALIAAGQDVVNFTAGEPDFDTPAHIRQAGVKAIEGGQTRYTAVGGTVALKAAVADRLLLDTGLTYQPNEILVSVGAKHSLYNAIMALVSPGDGVLVPVPYWVTYPEQILLAGGRVERVATAPAQRHQLRRDDLERVVTPATRGLILNSPCNPSGAVIPPLALQEIAAFAVDHDLFVLSDEIYGRLVYGGAQQVSIARYPGMRERTIVISGVSKSYAMTGWRIGYAAGPAPVIQAMANLQSQSTSNPTSIAQAAAAAALAGPQQAVEEMRQEFDRRRQYAVEQIRRIPGLAVDAPDGAFYLWVDMAGVVGRTLAGREIRNADDLGLAWLEQSGVAVVPGSGFGVPNYFRMSYATSMAKLEQGLTRMRSLLEA
ncbi:MAG: pyridoxal phosphate-dependent aminotransferase [Thermaerobacter sp.]|nr:pyridoxal phosphate-dependent aminotransferase [Thermaerobacter sp.]